MAVEPFAAFFEPIRKTITVTGTPAHAFTVFTARLAAWWPLATQSLFRERAASCGIEPRAGGEVFELRDDGERCTWGTVLEWTPPERVVLSWHPGLPPDQAQEVEIRFTAVPGGTRVDLEHRGWARLGDRAARVRRTYDEGWEPVFTRAFRAACTQHEETT